MFKNNLLVIAIATVGVLFLVALAMLLWVFVLQSQPTVSTSEEIFQPDVFDTLNQKESDKIVLDLLNPTMLDGNAGSQNSELETLDLLSNNNDVQNIGLNFTSGTTSTTSNISSDDVFFDYTNYTTPQQSIDNLDALMR